MEKTKFHVLIKRCFLMGKNTIQTQQWLEKCYTESTPSKTNICHWFAEFKQGHTNTDDAECLGHPKEVIIPENIKQSSKLFWTICKVKLQEIADIMTILKGSTFDILHKNVSMRNLFQMGAMFAQWNKNVLMIQSTVWNFLSGIKMNFFISM